MSFPESSPTRGVSPGVALSVQYATEAPELPRWRLRRWVQHAVRQTAAEEATLLDEPRFRRVALTLRLVDDDEGRRLNLEYRERDYATNVLTFEYGVEPDGTASGDIVLCVPVLHREAGEQGKPLLAHAAHLTVHGVLHALGYDHLEEEDAHDMESLETRILAGLRIPDPYA
jgi:probable rRNA maturation factor